MEESKDDCGRTFWNRRLSVSTRARKSTVRRQIDRSPARIDYEHYFSDLEDTNSVSISIWKEDQELNGNIGETSYRSQTEM